MPCISWTCRVPCAGQHVCGDRPGPGAFPKDRDTAQEWDCWCPTRSSAVDPCLHGCRFLLLASSCSSVPLPCAATAAGFPALASLLPALPFVPQIVLPAPFLATLTPLSSELPEISAGACFSAACDSWPFHPLPPLDSPTLSPVTL